MPSTNLQAKFNAFPWQHSDAHLHARQRGQAGIPVVGMHNRVRMVVGSFLVKNLQLHIGATASVGSVISWSMLTLLTTVIEIVVTSVDDSGHLLALAVRFLQEVLAVFVL